MVTTETCLRFYQLFSNFPNQVLGEILCGLIPFITTLAILVNSFTLVGIAIDRYLAVIRWIKGTWEPSTLFCGAGAVFVWGLAGIASAKVGRMLKTNNRIIFL